MFHTQKSATFTQMWKAAETRLRHPKGALFEEGRKKDPKKRDRIKMYKRKGGRLLQMSGPNLHEWQRAKLQGMGGATHHPPPPPHPPFFLGGTKREL